MGQTLVRPTARPPGLLTSPQSDVQHPAQEEENIIANPTDPLPDTDCPDIDDDSGAPDVVAHIIIRAVPDSAAN